jgi:hypothetical protein
MGQFQSKEYDGDPYVDLMRALPERELIWWVQKAIWVSKVKISNISWQQQWHKPKPQRLGSPHTARGHPHLQDQISVAY